MNRRRGFSLVEVLVAITITGTGIVAVMKLLPAVAQTAETSHDIAAAIGLARLLIDEIDLVPFKDTAANCTFGREPDETAPTRADFDDVDDYSGYTDQPPVSRAGLADTTYAAYRRTVSVVNVDPNDLTTVATNGTTDAKQVTVTVTCSGREVARLVVIRFFGANKADAPLLEEPLVPAP